MTITISPRAEKDLKKIPKIDQIALAQKLRGLYASSKKGEKLAGYKNVYRIRVGNYRIVYRYMPKEIYLVIIGHRKDIYRRLEQFWR